MGSEGQTWSNPRSSSYKDLEGGLKRASESTKVAPNMLYWIKIWRLNSPFHSNQTVVLCRRVWVYKALIFTWLRFKDWSFKSPSRSDHGIKLSFYLIVEENYEAYSLGLEVV
ncbi:hypothetical protein TNCV_507101 [Trichonephila clavipes]|nr:hypothetical protein TNCV_507101 [Trichonephila clavipes]